MSGGEPNGGPSPKEALPLEDVRRLVELLAESGVGEIRVKQGELEITVKARTEASTGTSTVPYSPQVAPEPIVSGRYFFPNAPELCLKRMPAAVVASLNVTPAGGAE